MYYEDPIDCSDERELSACIWQDSYDDCDDVAYCYVTWVESNRQQNDTCTNFQTWHEEWLVCRPVETSYECEDESGLPECSRTYYHEPCTDIEICWVEYTDLEGESSNITCTQYFDWLENIENGDWCRYLDFNESCASFDWTGDQDCILDYQVNSCNFSDFSCSQQATDGLWSSDCAWLFDTYDNWRWFSQDSFWSNTEEQYAAIVHDYWDLYYYDDFHCEVLEQPIKCQ